MIPRDLADEFRRARDMLDELWQSIQDAGLDDDECDALCRRVESAGEELAISEKETG